MSESLEARVAQQFPILYLTLVSVLVGIVLADLFTTIHSRMILWPLTLETDRTWCQIFGIILAVLSSWVTYSHLGLLRHRLPTIWDTVDVILVLVTIPLNAATGLHEAAVWFFWAGCFALLSVTAVRINLHQGAREPALAHLQRLSRIGGPYTLAYLGVPGYMAMAAASYLHLAPLWLELAAAATAPVVGVLVTILFVREWRAAVLNPPPATSQADVGSPG